MFLSAPLRLARRQSLLVGLTLPLVSLSSVVHAQLAEGRNALGEAMVEHSCFHTTFGPFVSVPGTPGDNASGSTPNVDPVHTEYRVGLPLTGETHVVTYAPERSGNWVVFTGSDLPLEVVDKNGESLPVVFEQREDTGCDALPIGRVYSLTAKQRYTIRLGPAEATSVMLVIEYADDFLVRVGRDEDGDGYGSTADAFITNCAPPMGFAPNTSDCDDSNPEINPGAAERCDDVDWNCNGSTDDVGLQCRAGAGACTVVGAFICEGEFATCDATALDSTEESCNGKDDDCDGTIDNGGDSLCEDVAKPRCVRRDFSAFCGCLLDGDCGGLDSGRICDLEANSCEDGCSTVTGGNGCPEGERCETEGGVTRGVCLPAQPDTTEDEPDEQVKQRGIGDSNTEGCQCTLGPVTAPRWSALALFGSLAFAWVQRRRARTTHQNSVRGC